MQSRRSCNANILHSASSLHLDLQCAFAAESANRRRCASSSSLAFTCHEGGVRILFSQTEKILFESYSQNRVMEWLPKSGERERERERESSRGKLLVLGLNERHYVHWGSILHPPFKYGRCVSHTLRLSGVVACAFEHCANRPVLLV